MDHRVAPKNRLAQSAPPSIHDVLRGLPIGPGGVEPFVFRDRGRHPRGPAHFPWRRLILAGTRAGRGVIAFWQAVTRTLTMRPPGRLNRISGNSCK